MGSLNKATLIGNLGQDAELKYTQAGTAVATVSLATNESWKDAATGQKKERVEWHRCVLWGKTAEALAEYLTKGKQVYVEGRIQTRKWKDKDGNDRYSTEIHVDKVVLLGGPGKKESGAQPEYAGAGVTSEVNDDDIPF